MLKSDVPVILYINITAFFLRLINTIGTDSDTSAVWIVFALCSGRRGHLPLEETAVSGQDKHRNHYLSLNPIVAFIL